MSCSSVGLEHRSYAPGVMGSSPVSTIPFFFFCLFRFPFIFYLFILFFVHLSLYSLSLSLASRAYRASRLLSGPLSSHWFLFPTGSYHIGHLLLLLREVCHLARGQGLLCDLREALHHSVLFSHLASLFSLVALSLSPLGAFLLFRARECARHVPKSPCGPPRAHGPTVFDSLHAHAAPSVRTAPR